MKLSSIDFNLDWPVAVEVKNLRGYVLENLEIKGDVIRWSIVDIQNSINSCGTKILKIKAVIAN